MRSSFTLARDFRLTFETARPLLDDLTVWAESVPNAASGDSLEGREDLASLHIAYHSLKILIFRALLRPFNRAHCQVPSEDKAEWEAAKTHIRQAARAEIDAVLNRISALEAMDYQAFWAPCMSAPLILIELIFDI